VNVRWFAQYVSLGCLADPNMIDHEAMLGMKQAEAGSDLITHKQKKTKIKEELEEEEWVGIGS